MPSRTIPYEPCHRTQHAMMDGTDPTWIPPFNLIGEVKICEICGTVRRRGIDALGRVATTRYIWPFDYSLGPDGPSKEELRKQWYAREKKKQRKLRAVG